MIYYSIVIISDDNLNSKHHYQHIIIYIYIYYLMVAYNDKCDIYIYTSVKHE